MSHQPDKLYKWQLPHSSVGYADLLWGFYSGPPLTETQQANVARLLKFEPLTDIKTEKENDGKSQFQQFVTETYIKTDSTPHSNSEESAKIASSSYFRVIHREQKQVEDQSMSIVNWLEQAGDVLSQNKRFTPREHRITVSYPPLIPWSRLLPVLLKTLGGNQPGRNPDVDKLVKWQASCQQLTHLPKKHRYTWKSQSWLLIDNNPDSIPFRQDYHALHHKLRDWRGSEGLDVQFVHRAEPGKEIVRYRGKKPVYAQWQMPDNSTPLLILSDLGLHSNNDGAVDNWLAFGQQLKQYGLRPTVLLPVACRKLDLRLLHFYNCIIWDRHSNLKPQNSDSIGTTIDDEQQFIKTLLALCYPAIQVSPGLLRSIRYLLPPACDASVEVALRRQPHLKDTEQSDWSWMPDSKAAYLPEFLSQFQQLTTAQQQSLIWHIATHHAQIADEHYFEVLSELQRLGIELPDSIKQAIDDYLPQLIKSYYRYENHHGLNNWANRYLSRLAFSKDYPFSQQQQVMRILVTLRNDDKTKPAIQWPEDIPKELLRQFLPAGEPLQQLLLCQVGTQLKLSSASKAYAEQEWGAPVVVLGLPFIQNTVIYAYTDTQGKSHTYSLDLNTAEPVMLDLLPGTHSIEINNEIFEIEALDQENLPAYMAGISMEGTYTSMQTRNNADQYFTWYWQPPILKGQQLQPNEHSSKVLTCPGFWWYRPQLDAVVSEDWPYPLYRDEYGLYADVNIAGVIQRFRWIQPGEFMMGYPDDEEGRNSNELLHKVILSQGYWLADTACTQALWQAVMGDKPSYFKGTERPVENVSWDDVQVFLQKINQKQPFLDLRLPTEAEWEYACRAGTKTAFNFKESLSTALVNYRGTWEFEVDKWANNALRETTEVKNKSYPSNAWGLYQMHGNVLEWCQDYYGEYTSKQVTDPHGPASGAYRVLRGGSWDDVGGRCRSAYRDCAPPGFAIQYIGFRLSRGHEYSEAAADRLPDGAHAAVARGTQAGDGLRDSDNTLADKSLLSKITKRFKK
ncbi:formylglycine-generating enzyme family protein [Methylomonas sp. AM2-LC]|uniref:formylglycine-generating enzyme family protein n=1 Tax=Methylomonas sp. AM2-LC TaxID=3153301 RepID=UPI003263DB93